MTDEQTIHQRAAEKAIAYMIQAAPPYGTHADFKPLVEAVAHILNDEYGDPDALVEVVEDVAVHLQDRLDTMHGNLPAVDARIEELQTRLAKVRADLHAVETSVVTDAKSIGEAHAMASEVAEAIHKERTGACQWEAWSGMLPKDGEIVDAKADPDGNLVLSIAFDDLDGHESGLFELVLKPVSWRRVHPKRRRLRAKDVRAKQRGGRR